MIIDGQDQGVTGNADCTMAAGMIVIVITAGMASYNVDLTDGNPPDVDNVTLVNPKNRLNLNYVHGMGQGSAQATKDGNTFKITGTATGTDGSTQGQVSKTFEVDAACTSN